MSDRTGEIVRDTTRRERMWNWCGAVLHWLYFTELRHDRAFLAPACAVIVRRRDGLVVYRCRGRAEARRWPRARYRAVGCHRIMARYTGIMSWAWIVAVPLCTWIVSGWMSLESGQWVSGSCYWTVMMSERYTALDHSRASFTIPPATAWHAAPMVPPAKEVRL